MDHTEQDAQHDDAHHDDARHDDAYQFATRLGVVLEATRLGSPVVGTEHMLMATMGHPLIRWTMNGLGHQLRDVQALVTRADEHRRGPHDAEPALSPSARDLITLVRADHSHIDLDGPIPPAEFAACLQSIFVWLLTHDVDCAGRRILEELRITKHVGTVLRILDENDGLPRIPGPRPAPDDAAGADPRGGGGPPADRPMR